MDLQVKRNELSNWVENLGEEMLTIIDELKKSTSSKTVVTYTSKNIGLTKKDYINHIEGISDRIKNGDKTYATKEVRNAIIKE